MKQGDCRGEPGVCCGWEGWAQARGQVAGWDAVEVGRPNLSLCLPKAFQEGSRAGLGDVVPPHGCLRGPCIPPGGLPCLPPALPALPAACLACCLHIEPSGCCSSLGTGGSSGAHHAAWLGASHALGITAEMDPDLDALLLLQYKCLPQGIISAGNYAKSIN